MRVIILILNSKCFPMNKWWNISPIYHLLALIISYLVLLLTFSLFFILTYFSKAPKSRDLHLLSVLRRKESWYILNNHCVLGIVLERQCSEKCYEVGIITSIEKLRCTVVKYYRPIVTFELLTKHCQAHCLISILPLCLSYLVYSKVSFCWLQLI